MPIRNASQRIGRTGEHAVESLIDDHPRWVARRQDSDFGIDLEAELANPGPEGQVLRGQLVKLQIKAGASRWRFPTDEYPLLGCGFSQRMADVGAHSCRLVPDEQTIDNATTLPESRLAAVHQFRPAPAPTPLIRPCYHRHA